MYSKVKGHFLYWFEKQLMRAYFNAISPSNPENLHSIKQTVQSEGMTVHILPALQNNFMYLIIDEKTKEAAIVDPVNPNLVSSTVEENNVNLTTILTTHHHWDHAGGNRALARKFENIEILGGDPRISSVTKIVSHGDVFNIGELKIECLKTPCHTSGHFCYVVSGKNNDPPSVFTGDTLFVGGCGRFFEGTADQMYHSLLKILGTLPDETKVYCGHEAACSSLRFSRMVEPDNQDIKDKHNWSMTQRGKKFPTVPSTIADEKKTNPFMRVHEQSVMKHAGTTDPIQTMASIRREKDNFNKRNLD